MSALFAHLRRPVNKIILGCALLLLVVAYFGRTLRTAFVIGITPLIWKHHESDFLISQERDNFDVTFSNYSITQTTSMPDYEDQVPAVLHHITLGSKRKGHDWNDARQTCLDFHPGWESILWDDEKADAFVSEKFPQMKTMWDEYRFPVQRVDSLRYMILYEYGGAVLDMDLECRRSLGPLRRFKFVAPAAHPMGFSNGFMMASKRHPFVADMIRNLPNYDLHWYGLPYPTVMFSTGCHYASAIHTLQKDRADLKILSGGKSAPKLHRLNGNVTTPLFHHLGSSSWHSFDAALIMMLGKTSVYMWIVAVSGLCTMSVAVWCCVLRNRVKRGGHDSPKGPGSPVMTGVKMV